MKMKFAPLTVVAVLMARSCDAVPKRKLEVEILNNIVFHQTLFQSWSTYNRMTQQVSDLGWVDFGFGCPSVCQITLWLKRDRQKGHSCGSTQPRSETSCVTLWRE